MTLIGSKRKWLTGASDNIERNEKGDGFFFDHDGDKLLYREVSISPDTGDLRPVRAPSAGASYEKWLFCFYENIPPLRQIVLNEIQA
jgi:hypothetical protein